MGNLIYVLLFPLIWPWAAKFIWKKELSGAEITLQVVLVCLLVAGVWQLGKFSKTFDTEILNGQITGKERKKVSCEHSYECNCTDACSGSGKDRSCSRVCQTCYEHSYDISWFVYDNVDNSFTVDRVDSQGLNQPPRWGLFQPGQPYAASHHFTNYIKAVPESVFNFSFVGLEQFKPLIPVYPNSPYDYQYVDRVLPMGVAVPDIRNWNYDLAMTLRDLGPKKQANVVIVMVKTPERAYINALRSAWLGGKKNDIVVVLGVPEYPKIAWAEVMSWSDKELFKVQLRDSIQELGTVDREKIIGLIHDQTLQNFTRKRMNDFKYLEYEIQPDDWVIALAALLAVLGSIGLSFYFSRPGVEINFSDLLQGDFSGLTGNSYRSRNRFGRY